MGGHGRHATGGNRPGGTDRRQPTGDTPASALVPSPNAAGRVLPAATTEIKRRDAPTREVYASPGRCRRRTSRPASPRPDGEPGGHGARRPRRPSREAPTSTTSSAG